MTTSMHPRHGRVPLWRDVRVLQWLFQLAVVAVVIVLVLWLYGNYTENAGRQNIPTSLDFLDNPAAFEITGNDISQNAPVRDAIVQGVLNTLRVSVVGVVLATVLGTLVGIGRLSRNWLVRSLATVFVEAIRNAPLPLFVVMASLAIVLGVFPRIQDAWEPLGLIVISNRGIAVPWFTGSGFALVALVAAAAGGMVARRRVAPARVRPDGYADRGRACGGPPPQWWCS
jgi:general L-amino acid transport system permease protein